MLGSCLKSLDVEDFSEFQISKKTGEKMLKFFENSGKNLYLNHDRGFPKYALFFTLMGRGSIARGLLEAGSLSVVVRYFSLLPGSPLIS